MPACGAKTQAGTPCKRAGRANGRCNLHGGKTPKGQRNALKHGIYAVGIREDEKELWEDIPIGTLDDELRLARLQLRRALEAQRRADEAAADGRPVEGLELTEVSRAKSDKKLSLSEKRTRPDYRAEINRLLGRIADLETKRLALTGGAGVRDPREWAEEIQQALREIETTDGPDVAVDAA